MSLDLIEIDPDGRPVAANGGFHAKSDRAVVPLKKVNWRDSVFNAALLRTEQFPEISYVIAGLIPEGLSILAGRPKVGKSWMALDIVFAVASGGHVLGDGRAQQGDVLYCALEDNKRRLQKRLDKVAGGREWPSQLTLATQWRRLDAGGVDDIRAWADEASNPKLVVLDTLAGVRPERNSKDTLYDGDYKALAELHAWANEKGIAVIILHHTRKMEADDPLDTVSGSLGLVGCADTTLVIARSSQGTTLYVRGRDIEEAEHAVNFNAETCRWTIMGDAADVRRSDSRGSILSVLQDADAPMSPNEIASAAMLTRNNVDQLLFQMVKSCEVIKISRGNYVSAKRQDLLPANKTKETPMQGAEE